MKNVFALIIIFSLICFLVLFKRKQFNRKAVSRRKGRLQRLQSLVGTQETTSADESWVKKIGMNLVYKTYSILMIFQGEDKKTFIINLIIPAGFGIAITVANEMYIGLPMLWVAVSVTPFAYLTFYKILNKKKRKAFNVNFSEALTTINGAISSGRTFLQAMSDYACQSDNILSREFGMISRRLNMGDDPEKLFIDSWRRYPYREYYFFIVAILLNFQGGGRLKEVLVKLQKAISTGIAMEKKMLAMTSEMRMASKITGAIPFIFLLLLKFISPENFDFVLYDESGKVILYYLLGSELVGMLVLKFLMRGV